VVRSASHCSSDGCEPPLTVTSEANVASRLRARTGLSAMLERRPRPKSRAHDGVLKRAEHGTCGLWGIRIAPLLNGGQQGHKIAAHAKRLRDSRPAARRVMPGGRRGGARPKGNGHRGRGANRTQMTRPTEKTTSTETTYWTRSVTCEGPLFSPTTSATSQQKNRGPKNRANNPNRKRPAHDSTSGPPPLARRTQMKAACQGTDRRWMIAAFRGAIDGAVYDDRPSWCGLVPGC